MFVKDTFSGDFVGGWTEALEQSKFKKVIISPMNACIYL